MSMFNWFQEIVFKDQIFHLPSKAYLIYYIKTIYFTIKYYDNKV